MSRALRLRHVAAVATVAAAAGAGVALAGGDGDARAAAVGPSTRADLLAAMHGEAFANARYGAFGEAARGGGRSALADLFDATARVESGQHFAEEAALAGLVGSDEANLRDAIAGEGYETTTMYPAYARRARADGTPRVARRLAEIGRDEAGHRALFRAALGALASGHGDAGVPDAPESTDVAVARGRSQLCGRTVGNVDRAMHGESFAFAKYTLYADGARRNGRPRLASLFEHIAAVELHQHFAQEAALAGLVGSDAENLRTSIDGENGEARRMYPRMARRADAAGDTAAAGRLREIGTDEARHRDAYRRALIRLHRATT